MIVVIKKVSCLDLRLHNFFALISADDMPADTLFFPIIALYVINKKVWVNYSKANMNVKVTVLLFRNDQNGLGKHFLS